MSVALTERQASVEVDSHGLIILNPTVIRVFFVGRLRTGYVGHESGAKDLLFLQN